MIDVHNIVLSYFYQVHWIKLYDNREEKDNIYRMIQGISGTALSYRVLPFIIFHISLGHKLY